MRGRRRSARHRPAVEHAESRLLAPAGARCLDPSPTDHPESRNCEVDSMVTDQKTSGTDALASRQVRQAPAASEAVGGVLRRRSACGRCSHRLALDGGEATVAPSGTARRDRARCRLRAGDSTTDRVPGRPARARPRGETPAPSSTSRRLRRAIVQPDLPRRREGALQRRAGDPRSSARSASELASACSRRRPRRRRDGKVADYIPQLGRVDPEQYGVAADHDRRPACTALETARRHLLRAVDAASRSTTCLALEEHGSRRRCTGFVGCEPSSGTELQRAHPRQARGCRTTR